MASDVSPTSRAVALLSQPSMALAVPDPDKTKFLKLTLPDLKKKGMNGQSWEKYIVSHYLAPREEFYTKAIEDCDRRIKVSKQAQGASLARLPGLKPDVDGTQIALIRTDVAKHTAAAKKFSAQRANFQETVAKFPLQRMQLHAFLEEIDSIKPSGRKVWQENTETSLLKLHAMVSELGDLSSMYKTFDIHRSGMFVDHDALTDQVVANPGSIAIVENMMSDRQHVDAELDVIYHFQHLLIERIIEISGPTNFPYHTFEVTINYGASNVKYDYVCYNKDGKWRILDSLGKDQSTFMKESTFRRVFCQRIEEDIHFVTNPVIQVRFMLAGQDIGAQKELDTCIKTKQPISKDLANRLQAQFVVGYGLGPHDQQGSNYIEINGVVQVSDGRFLLFSVPNLESLPPELRKNRMELAHFARESVTQLTEKLRNDLLANAKGTYEYSLIIPATPEQREFLQMKAFLELLEDAQKDPTSEENAQFIAWAAQELSSEPLLETPSAPALKASASAVVVEEVVDEEPPVLDDANASASPAMAAAVVVADVELQGPGPASVELQAPANGVVEEVSAEELFQPAEIVAGLIAQTKSRIEVLEKDAADIIPDEKESMSDTDAQRRAEKEAAKEQRRREFEFKKAKAGKRAAQAAASFQVPVDHRPLDLQLNSKTRRQIEAIREGQRLNAREYQGVVKKAIQARFNTRLETLKKRQDGSHVNYDGLPTTFVVPHGRDANRGLPLRLQQEQLATVLGDDTVV